MHMPDQERSDGEKMELLVYRIRMALRTLRLLSGTDKSTNAVSAFIATC